MFAYNPTVNDQSGQILGQAQVGAAQTQAQSMQQMGEDIGGAIAALGTMYAEDKMQKAGGKAFKDFMGMAGPSMGLKEEDLKAFKGMTDYDAYQLSQSFMPVAPSMISASGLGSYNNRMMLANQQAANQMALRQPAPNQVPMAPPSSVDPSTTPPPPQGAPAFAAGINTRPAF